MVRVYTPRSRRSESAAANPRAGRLGARDGRKTAIMRAWTDDMRPRRRREPVERDGGRRQNTGVALGASLLGAIVTFLYFRYVDVGASAPRPGPGELIFSGVAFAVLGAIGLSLSNRWLRPLLRHRVDPASPIDERVRQRALLLPYAIALVTFSDGPWRESSGASSGRSWPGPSRWNNALRSLFGTSVIAGMLATAFVFLAVEHQWRRMLPRYFPAGDLSSVPGVPRLGVRARLLGVFLLVGALPVSVLGLIAYTRITAMRGASPDEAARLIHDLVFLVLFVAVVGLAMSVVLSLHVARSVAEPLREVERAMDGVAGGDLDQRALVVSTDEIGAVAEGFNRMVQGLREREQIKETFGRYVSREIRDEILAGRVALGGQTLDVTILFSDLRDFTPWVEATPAADVVQALNSYFSEMEAAIRGHHGLVLQFIGDEIEAVFGAPVPTSDHPTMAVRAALEMRRRLAAWNDRRRAAGQPIFRHGIGIHSGIVLAGNIGSPERLSYSLVGDPVNLASRIQSLNKDFGSDILVSGTTRKRLAADVDLVALARGAREGQVHRGRGLAPALSVSPTGS